MVMDMLYVFDVGNTLKKNGIINVKNKTVINQLNINDDVCIATFRHKALLNNDLKSMDYKFLITHNGGAVYSNNSLLHVEYIKPNIVDQIYHYASSNNLSIAFYKLDSSYCLNPTDLQTVKERQFPIQNMVKKYSSKNILSVVLFGDQPIQLSFKNIAIDYWDNSTKCNIQSINATKTHAIEKIQALLNISWNDTISFGDGPNDTDIIQKSSIGYVMNNSHPNTLAVANEILDNDDGLAVYRQLSKIKYNHLSNH
jgi:hypothetical protein